MDSFLNWVIQRCPAWIQILFMGRVIKSVKAYRLQEEANQGLLTEKEGRLRTGRLHRFPHSVQPARMDVLPMQPTNQPLPTYSELLRRDRRTYRTSRERWNSHLG